MEKDTTYSKYQAGSDELIHLLVEEHHGWTTSIARSVARAWNLDWQLDGLDGGAYEGLLFCSRRYDPDKGVPFRAYARRRIHESSTQAARESKSWQRGVSMGSSNDQDAREISAHLFDIYGELREGLLPAASNVTDGEATMRASIRQLLASASLLALFQESTTQNPEFTVEFRRMLTVVSEMETVHQLIIWNMYWQGSSMRALAKKWEVDELAVIREHQVILKFVEARLNNPRSRITKRLKIRLGLRSIAQKIRKNSPKPPFEQFRESTAIAIVLAAVLKEILIYA